MNETIIKLQADLDAHLAAEEAAINAMNAPGVSDEDFATHKAAFEAASAKKSRARQLLGAASDNARCRAELNAARTQPATPAIITSLSESHRPPAPRGTVPANVRRVANMKAFKGPDAEANAYRAGLWAAATLFNHAGCRAKYADQFGANDLVNAPSAITLSGSSNSSGGFFVPDVMDYAVVELAEAFGIFRQYAERVPMSSETETSPRWTGSMTAYYVGEGVAPTQSDPAWDPIMLVAKILAAMSKMSRTLNEDAVIDLAEKVAMAAAVAFAEAEDDAGFNGDGTSTYGGITGLRTKLVAAANAASLVTATGHTTLGALTITDFENVMGKLPVYTGIKPAFFCHKSVYHASMAILKNTAGGVTAAELTAGSTPQYGGYPVVFAQKMPAASSVTTGVTGIIFGDIGMAAKFGDRRGRTFESGFVNDDFTKQLITLLATQRYDINCHTIVDPRNSSNAGPVIGLKLG